MKIQTLFFALLWSAIANAQTVMGPKGEVFTQRLVKDQLSDPWEMIYGPDGNLWITEARGYTVSQINIATGAKTVLLDLNSQKNFPRYDKIDDAIDGGKPWPQGGLMGMALHPNILTTQAFVYLAYVYNFSGAGAAGNGCVANDGGCFFTTRVVRYEYNSSTKTLFNASILCDSIPGSSDHNSGRMTIAPINGVNYLFYTVGDMGGGQFSNAGRPIKSQATDSYEGKVLRFNLVPDADAGTYDRWIPNDNPFNLPGKQNAVWTVGHRNAQGITYGEAGGVGRIYTDEHGPFSDDEVNIEEAGKNYGHPLVIGKNDGNYNNASAGASCNTSLPNANYSLAPIITNENSNAISIGANFREPIFTLYSSTNAKITSLYNAQINSCGSDNNTWDSEAPSSILMYTNSTIPGWKRNLFIPTLKGGKVIRLTLNALGNGITGDTVGYFRSANRYRDIAFSPDGYKVYLAVDSSSITSGPSATNPVVSTNRGSILEFTYVSGGVLALGNPTTVVPTKKNYVLSISPVPTNNLLRVQLKSGTAKPLHYELKDLTGMVVLKGEKTTDDFSLSLLPLKTGMYFLQLIDTNGQVLANEKVIRL